jgi:zinc protease
MKNLYKIFFTVLFLQIICGANAQNFKVPAYNTFKLQNGLTVYLMEQHEVPMISVNIILPAGAIYDNGKSGLATLTANALMHGTKSYTKAKLAEELDFLATGINTSASKEFASITSKFAAKDKDKVLAILQEVLLSPTFDAKEFEKEKTRTLKAYEQAKESPRRVINAYFDNAIYSGHVYGNVTLGTASAIKKLTALDCKNFYNSYYAPAASAISIVGDFSTNEIKTTLATLFGKWKNTTTAVINNADKPLPNLTENKVLLVNKEDAKETTFMIGAKGISRNNPDYVSIEVVNTLFGGRFTSMLNDALRVNSGLTYGASSRFNSLKNGGAFIISTFTATKTTEPAIDMALDVLNNLHKNGLNDTALTSAKNYVKGQFPPKYETTDELAGLLTQMFWYKFDENYINSFEKNVSELTLTKANEIIAKYFPKNNLQFVLIGKAADIKNIASKYGKVTQVNIKDDIK